MRNLIDIYSAGAIAACYYLFVKFIDFSEGISMTTYLSHFFKFSHVHFSYLKEAKKHFVDVSLIRSFHVRTPLIGAARATSILKEKRAMPRRGFPHEYVGTYLKFDSIHRILTTSSAPPDRSNTDFPIILELLDAFTSNATCRDAKYSSA